MKKVIIYVVLLMSVSSVNAKRMQSMGAVETVLSRPVVTPIPAPIAMPKIDQVAIKKRLDEQLHSPVEAAWNDRINDLFDLAMVNRELARDYFIKMRTKMEEDTSTKADDKKSEEITLPAGEEPMKKTTRPAPPRKPAMPKVEPTQPVPSDEEPMKKSTAPAPKKGAPRGGPAKKIDGPAKAEASKPGMPTPIAPKASEQVFSKSKLEQLDNDKLLQLFNDLLDKLGTVGTNWNNTVVERIEEKTKYGQKSYNVYGAPVAKWKNDIDTLKKVLISKNIMPEAEVAKVINDRIAQVRAEKTVKPVAQPEVEKAKEELTEDDLAKQIKAQLAEPKSDQIGWVVSVKGNIKALDKLNHTVAMQYHDQFIKITKEKPFLKQ